MFLTFDSNSRTRSAVHFYDGEPPDTWCNWIDFVGNMGSTTARLRFEGNDVYLALSSRIKARAWMRPEDDSSDSEDDCPDYCPLLMAEYWMETLNRASGW